MAAYGIVGGISFGDFLKAYAGQGMLRPQTYWLKSFDNTIKLDYIGRFENLSNDFQEVCRLIGIDYMPLPHELNGGKEDYRNYYDRELVKLVGRLDIETIRMFNYSP
jgi:hypothetical protein